MEGIRKLVEVESVLEEIQDRLGSTCIPTKLDELLDSGHLPVLEVDGLLVNGSKVDHAVIDEALLHLGSSG